MTDEQAKVADPVQVARHLLQASIMTLKGMPEDMEPDELNAVVNMVNVNTQLAQAYALAEIAQVLRDLRTVFGEKTDSPDNLRQSRAPEPDNLRSISDSEGHATFGARLTSISSQAQSAWLPPDWTPHLIAANRWQIAMGDGRSMVQCPWPHCPHTVFRPAYVIKDHGHEIIRWWSCSVGTHLFMITPTGAQQIPPLTTRVKEG